METIPSSNCTSGIISGLEAHRIDITNNNTLWVVVIKPVCALAPLAGPPIGGMLLLGMLQWSKLSGILLWPGLSCRFTTRPAKRKLYCCSHCCCFFIFSSNLRVFNFDRIFFLLVEEFESRSLYLYVSFCLLAVFVSRVNVFIYFTTAF